MILLLRFATLVVLPVIALTAVPLRGEQLAIGPSQDATIFFNTETQASPTANGAGQSLFVGLINAPPNSTNGIRRGLIAFDIASAIQTLGVQPFDVQLDSVQLAMLVTKEAAGPNTADISLHRLQSAWTTGASAAGSASGGFNTALDHDATWYYASFPNQRWNNAGGDFAPSASATSTVGATTNARWESVGMLADVQSWLDRPSENFGWMLVGNETIQQSVKRFASKEALAAANRPRLLVNFTRLVPGDTDGNGKVDIVDFASVRRNFGKPVTTRLEGDLNRDSKVDIADFAILRLNFGRPSAVAPEPTAASLLGLAALFGMATRRNSRRALARRAK